MIEIKEVSYKKGFVGESWSYEDPHGNKIHVSRAWGLLMPCGVYVRVPHRSIKYSVEGDCAIVKEELLHDLGYEIKR